MHPSENITEFSTHIKLLSLLGLIIGLLCIKCVMLLKTSLNSAHIQHRHVVALNLNRLLPRELHQRVTSSILLLLLETTFPSLLACSVQLPSTIELFREG